MIRKKLLKRAVLILCMVLFVFGVSFYSYLALAHDPGSWWHTVKTAEVTLNGRRIFDAEIYSRPNGMLLMNLGHGNGWQLYRPDSQNIYWCNPIQHVSIPRYIYAYHCDSSFCPCVEMGGVKTDVDAQLKVGPNSIEFNSRDRQRFRVSW